RGILTFIELSSVPSATSPAPVASPPPAEARGGGRRALRAIATAVSEKLGPAALTLAAFVGFFVYPTYPNYDSYYSLLWGREVLDMQAPTFEGFRVPTEHPLAIVAGAALSLLGHVGDRVWVALIIASYLWLIARVSPLRDTAVTPLVAAQHRV